MGPWAWLGPPGMRALPPALICTAIPPLEDVFCVGPHLLHFPALLLSGACLSADHFPMYVMPVDLLLKCGGGGSKLNSSRQEGES